MVSQPVIACTPMKAFKKQFLSTPGSSCISELFTTNERSILLFAPPPFSCSTLWGLSYEQEVGQGHQCRQSGWQTYLPCAEHGEPYAYLPLRDCIVALEQVRMQLGLLSSTDLRLSRTWCGCRACLWMLLSSIVRQEIWQSLACLRWHWAACSMTSPFWQEVCRDSFQSFSILDRYLAIHVEHYVYAPAAGARLYHLKYSLSDHKERSSRRDLQLL